jgi:hypothetical protein
MAVAARESLNGGCVTRKIIGYCTKRFEGEKKGGGRLKFKCSDKFLLMAAQMSITASIDTFMMRRTSNAPVIVWTVFQGLS